MTKSIKRCRRLLALLLVVVIVSGSTYRARAAAVLPEVVVSGGEALAYLLGILGLTAGGSYVIDNKDDLISWGNTQIGKLKTWTKENSDKVNAWGAATSQEIETAIDTWIDKAAKGVIDTGSAVWDSLKAWGGSIYDSLHATDVPAATWGYGVQLPAAGDVYGFAMITSSTSSSDYSWIMYPKCSQQVFYAVNLSSDSKSCKYYFYSTQPFSVDATQYKYYVSGKTETKDLQAYYVSNCSTVINGVTVYYYYMRTSASSGHFELKGLTSCGTDVLSEIINGMSIAVPEDEYISVGGVSDIFDRDKTLDNIGVAVPGIAAGATDIPIDWGLVGDIAGTLTDVRAGVKDIADALADAKVFPIDTTRDTVIDSDGDLSNDKAKDDVIPAVPNVGTLDDYKLAGLEKVFPFCIPFDLIAFLGCLSAAPEAPAFDWVFPLPGKDGKEYTLHVDLSPWEPVAKIARTMETLAFCIGLVMITREKMIVS